MNQLIRSNIARLPQQGEIVPVRPSDVIRLESRIGFSLPEDYKSIMCEIGGFDLMDLTQAGETTIYINSLYDLDLTIKKFEKINEMSIGDLLRYRAFPIGGIEGVGDLFLLANGQSNEKCVCGFFIDGTIDVDIRYSWKSFSDMVLTYFDVISFGKKPMVRFCRPVDMDRVQENRDNFDSMLGNIG